MNLGRSVPLAAWAPLHPAAAAFSSGALEIPAVSGQRPPRSPALAAALAATNRRWGNDVDARLQAWLHGAEVVVTGQQPGLLGGPLLTLHKACAVAAEVRRRQGAGRAAVGFLWLATADDDLPEMGWAQLASGEELLRTREESFTRRAAMGGRARLGETCSRLLDSVLAAGVQELGQEAVALARDCYAPDTTLGEATGRFLARVLAGTEVVLVDALEPELARLGRVVVTEALRQLPGCHDALEAGSRSFEAHGWSAPLQVARRRLPAFRIRGDQRETLASHDGGCPPGLLAEVERSPESFVPNVWLRPFVQDAALDTDTVILGSAELAYHLQAAELWPLLGATRPGWRLRPHVTVLTAAERRLAAQLGLAPDDLLHPRPPRGAMPGRSTRRRLERLRAAVDREMTALASSARSELPALGGDVEGTSRKINAAVTWLGERLEATAERTGQTEASRWRRLRAFVRPGGAPQERALSALAPLLRLGVTWPARLAEVLDPADPGMHLLFWEEGGAW